MFHKAGHVRSDRLCTLFHVFFFSLQLFSLYFALYNQSLLLLLYLLQCPQASINISHVFSFFCLLSTDRSFFFIVPIFCLHSFYVACHGSLISWDSYFYLFIYIYILPLSCFGFILTSLLRYYSFLKCPFPSLAPAEVRWAPELLFIFVFIIRTAFFSWSWLTSRRFEVTLCLYDFVWFLAWSLFMWSLHVFSVPACVSSGSSGLWM